MRRIAATTAVMAIALIASPGRAQTALPQLEQQITLVYRVTSDALFTPTGDVGPGAAAEVSRLHADLRWLRGQQDVPYAIALNGVLCDELRLFDTPAAKGARAEIARISRTHRVLKTQYSEVTPSDQSTDDLIADIRSGVAAVQACVDVGVKIADPFVPADLFVDADTAAAIRGDGSASLLSAYAVPDVDERPAILPAATGELEPGLPLPRADEPALVLVVDPADRRTLPDTVAIDEFDGVDVTEGPASLQDPFPVGRVKGIATADEALDILRSYAPADAKQVEIFSTVLAHARAERDSRAATRLTAALKRERRLVTVSDGSITFTSRRGDVPVTIANDADYPVTVLVRVTSAKLDFGDGGGRRLEQRVTVEPPGNTFTFEALTRASGTFPVDVEISTPDGKVAFDRSALTVRSVSANLSAVVLTVGAALFLAVWFIRRMRRRGQTES